MNISYFLIVGLVLGLLLAYRANILLRSLLVVYWLFFFISMLGAMTPFHFEPLVWSQHLDITFSYHIDGLARIFALLISGIGVLVFLYASIYTQHSPQKRTKLFSILQIFAVSMLLLIMTDHLLVLFLAWELTTVTSYLLIQFDVTDPKANQAAFTGMFISVMGGLAMLVGFLLLHQYTGSWSIDYMINGFNWQISQLFPVFCLLILGAVTKSAQFPFYFWLPSAMKAPTPVSAYLHSATMVNAGIYLLARFQPALSILPQWYPTLAFFGMTTMFVAGVLSLYQRDLKAILAYTTLFALGSMVYLLGSNQWLSAEAFVMFLIFHALYKAMLFMWVGVIDQTYGTRDIVALKGIGQQWRLGSLVAVTGFAAMAGLPPFFGFIVKEMIFDAKLASETVSYGLITLSLCSSIMIAAVSFKCFYFWFRGKSTVQVKQLVRFGMLYPAVLMMLIILLNAVEPYFVELISVAASNIVNKAVPYQTIYTLDSASLSMVTVLGGVLLYFAVSNIRMALGVWPAYLNPAKLYTNGLSGVLYFGRWFTYVTQRRTLTQHMFIIVTVLLIWLVSGLYVSGIPFTVRSMSAPFWLTSVLAGVLAVSAISLLLSQRFLMNMVSLSVFGLALSAIFVLLGAPDVAMTQLFIEILTVVILVVALSDAKCDMPPVHDRTRFVHAILAGLLGLVVMVLLYLVIAQPFPNQVSQYYVQNSLPLAYGRNVVNVILVDFRALDTLGEALVILATALVVWVFIKKTAKRHI